MPKITEEMKEVAAKTRGWALATATREGLPNVVTIAFGKVLSENEILLMDVFMNKTEANIKANPNVAVAAWDLEALKGYQFQGTARFETSGKIFDEGFQMVKSLMPQLTPKAALIVEVKRIYNLTPGPEAGKEIV
jgi:hypothetical protein